MRSFKGFSFMSEFLLNGSSKIIAWVSGANMGARAPFSRGRAVGFRRFASTGATGVHAASASGYARHGSREDRPMTANETVCRRYRVTGKVQGVFYRASTRHEAERLGVTGYARNLPDGRVEVLACGHAAAVGALEAWLWRGPRAARVTSVDGEPVDVEIPAAFTTA
jgi:acylphosphatase